MLIVIIAVLIVALLLPLNMFGAPVAPVATDGEAAAGAASEAAETGESLVVQDEATVDLNAPDEGSAPIAPVE